MTKRLSKTLSITQAIGLGITVVVGSGLLLLPGIAYHQAGDASIYVWLLCGLLVMPLLVIFSALGAKYPSAGGVAGFVQSAFSRHFAAAVEVMLIGTFGLGIPAIALTGSYYLASFFNLDEQAELFFFGASITLIWVAFAINYLGARISGNVQKYLAIALVLILILIPITALMLAEGYHGEGVSPINSVDWSKVFPLIGLVFFAFTGWEMLSFTIEEYKNPKRDYPISVALSFVIVLTLYLLLVFAIQSIVPSDNPALNTAPLSLLAGQVLGKTAFYLVSVVSFVVILANIIGAVWASSRLVFSSSREGLLPGFIEKLSKNKTPQNALLVTCTVFSMVLALNYLKWLSVSDLLRIAGQNFFIIYGVAVLAYINTVDNIGKRLFGVLSLIIVVFTMSNFGMELLYPAFLLIIGYLLSRYQQSLSSRQSS